ncbi:MAG: OmpA family protein [Devosia sp.]|nr:OmpA family protein [Devosia sp.]
MQSIRLVAAGLAALIIGAPGLALAGATLTVVVGGEGFEGPPRFAVTFDGKPVGETAVDSAIDTRAAGRFADAPDKARYVKTFTFDIPDGVFKPDGVVAIALTNAAHGAPGSKDDRELFVQSVSVNGRSVPATSLSMRSQAGIEPTAMLGDYLVIAEAGMEGIALPSGGWGTKTVAAAVPEPAASPAPAAATGPKPAAVDNVETGSVAEVSAVATDAANANPDPEAGAPACDLEQKFAITGFARNSNDLTPAARQALDAVVTAIGTQQCVVHLTGYSSTEGDVAHNALFSIERSQNALHYLAAKGVKFRRYSANGVGETTQFGPDPAANRRVVVSVSP